MTVVGSEPADDAAEAGVGPGRLDRTQRREALSMGLYSAITLLAGLTVTSDESGHAETLVVIWGTTVGLALTHWFAFSLASRLVDPGVSSGLVEEFVPQLAAALVVAVLATAAVALLPDGVERAGARVAVAALIGVVTFAQLRAAGASRSRSLRWAAVALGLASVVVGVNQAVGH